MSLEEDVYCRLHLNSPPGGWFPVLHELTLCITESNLPFAGMFFSSHLKISISTTWSRSNSKIPSDILPALASTISALPASALQSLFMDVDHRGVPWAYFKDSLSPVVLRCGPSLRQLTSPIPLSDAATNHLIQLPHLHSWHAEGPPPSYSASPLPLDFPPLIDFTLGAGVACEWLSLFERLEDRVSSTQGMTPLSRLKESLIYLNINSFPGPVIDVSFTSSIQRFGNLVDLDIRVHCYDEYGEGQCAFNLNNNNVTELAMALPQLELLVLGHPCPDNTCATTVGCLLLVSVLCVRLEELQIHFNTTDTVDDLKNMLIDPRFQEIRSLPRCPLTQLDVFETPLDLDESDFETVALGMIDIFPSLETCEGLEDIWDELFVEFAGL